MRDAVPERRRLCALPDTESVLLNPVPRKTLVRPPVRKPFPDLTTSHAAAPMSFRDKNIHRLNESA
jgi:hypothetical protein